MTLSPEQRAEIWRQDARQAVTNRRVAGILEQVRLDGRAEGRKERDEYYAQLSMCRSDDAYENGWRDAHEQAPSRFRWSAFGAVIGSGATIITFFGSIIWAAIRAI